jgi:hypothetical protein
MATPPAGGETGGYAAQLDVLRSTAKWLTAAFAGVGGTLVAGLQLTGMGELPVSSWRFPVALVAVAVALASVGFMIRTASTVLTHEWLTLASFSDESVIRPPGRDDRRSRFIARARDELTYSRHELYGYAAPDIERLHGLLRRADEAIWRSRPKSKAHATAVEQAAMLRRAARDAVQYANYHYTLDLFRAMRTRIGIAAVAVAISATVFAYTTNPPKEEKSTRVQVQYVRPPIQSR